MGNLPHFLNWQNAAIAGAVAAPLLLLLYFLKLRRREMAVPSTLLWRKAIQDLQVNSPFQRLRRNLLLLLQMLLLAVLLFSLARPIMNYTPGAGASTIILIDRSASMGATDMPGGHTRLDEAKQRAKNLVDTMGRHDNAMVIAFDDSAEIVHPFTADPRELRNAIDTIQQTDRLTKFEEAYRLADAQTLLQPGQEHGSADAPKADVWLYSDGRASDAASAGVHGNLHYESIGSEKSGNIAVAAMNAQRDYRNPTQVQVFARLANFGPSPVSNVPVQLVVDGQVRSAGTVNLLPERYDDAQRKSAQEAGFIFKDSIEFPILELTTSSVVTVEQLAKEGDCLAADDSATVVVPPPKILSVLLVTDGNFFLEKGLSVQKLKDYQTMVPPEYKQKITSSSGLGKAYDVIIFDRYQPDKLPPNTSAFVYFDALPPGTALKAAATPAGEALTIEDNTVLDWKRDHPMLRHLNWGDLYVPKALKLLPTLDSQVLIEGSNGPLMVLHHESRAVHLVIPFDTDLSNWPLRGKFAMPIFLYQMLQYMSVASQMDLKPSWQPGVALRIPHAAIEKLDPALKFITLTGPGGSQKVTIPQHGDFVLPVLNRVGVYTTDPPIPQYETIAVSLLDANESNLQPAPVAPGAAGQVTVASSGKSRLELWWWLAAAALPLLLIEWWVYTRRVHL